MRAALDGNLDLGEKVGARLAAYASVTPPPIPPSVEIEAEDGGEAVIRVQCADRIGRLAEVVAALEDAGLEIRLAKVDGRSGVAVDVFHVPWHPRTQWRRHGLPRSRAARRDPPVTDVCRPRFAG